MELGPVGYVADISGRFLVAPMVVVNVGVTDRLGLVLEDN